MMTRHYFATFALGTTTALAAAASLSACGGSGGDAVRQVTNTSAEYPFESPGRKSERLVFNALDPASGQVHLYTAFDYGSAPIQLTQTFGNGSGNVKTFAISPNGTYVAFTANADFENTFNLYVVRADGGTPQVVASAPKDSAIRAFAWSPDSMYIAFVANPQGRDLYSLLLLDEAFIVSRNGSNLRKVSADLGSPPEITIPQIQWSPDGRYLAQAVYSVGPTHTPVAIDIHDTQQGSSTVRRITPAVTWTAPDMIGYWAWLPDSQRIAFHLTRDLRSRELYTVFADGSELTLISDVPTSGANRFSWSPDGLAIVYPGWDTNTAQIDLFASDPDGTNVRQLTHSGLPGNFTDQLQWSADGTRILYALDQDTADVNEVFIAAVDGSGSRRLNPPLSIGQNAEQPIWSPDENRIAYIANLDDVNRKEIYVADFDGSNNTNISGIATQDASSFAPTWAPNGDHVAFMSGSGSPYEIYVSSADGSSGVRINNDLSPGASTSRPLIWSSDSTRIAFRTYHDDGVDPWTWELWMGWTSGAAAISMSDPYEFLGQFTY